MLADERERPLLHPKLGAFLYADFRPFGVPPERREDGDLRMVAKRVIAPVPGGDHPAVQIHDPH